MKFFPTVSSFGHSTSSANAKGGGTGSGQPPTKNKFQKNEKMNCHRSSSHTCFVIANNEQRFFRFLAWRVNKQSRVNSRHQTFTTMYL